MLEYEVIQDFYQQYVSDIAIVSYTSSIPRNDRGRCLGLCTVAASTS